MKLAHLCFATLSLLVTTVSAQAKERIISIGGDVTEIIFALGAQDELVGRDTTSNQPAAVNKVKDIGYMRQLNTEGILSLKPTMVITSDLAQPSAVLEQIKKVGIPVVYVSGKHSLQVIPQKVETIAKALHREKEAKPLQDKMNKTIAALSSKQLPVKVIYIMAHGGMSNLVAGRDTAADSAIHDAGLQNGMGTSLHYQPMSQEGIIAAAPDIIMTDSDAIKTIGGADNLWKLPGVSMTPAGKKHNLIVIDQMALLGFGIRTPDAIKDLRAKAEALPHG
ncbi:ABC-type hemin transport system [Commensalibacter communis]|uniref:Periplasmic component (ChuT) n=1 Tax=Commensalibacter communis TaxID=2972786 RepID=A0A9W4X640_9PROT|nr:ABC transporter substrate-binding protein [Commensalibacter communis]CAI3928242.1 ABC-type hemin transport system [Commensalibacter communis]CAI3928820.1 ABC-type hemin transport system [Commensalibacter communis]CAI3932642.1 ABC-type hemin transport system [Commensalibacter communis]CAI3934181.1 ABC-type hemin transport system [Commensalibacter communis]CAI3940911.1 ABC-type hemin transport system [Commensalibacter communis]